MTKPKSQLILRLSLTALAVLVVGAVGSRFYVIQKEKGDFAAAESSIDALAQQIQDTIGKPDETKKEKSCGYASGKFEQGALSCGISHGLRYTATPAQAGDFMKNIAANVGSKLYHPLGYSTIEFVTSESEVREQSFSQDWENDITLACKVEYTYPPLSSTHMFSGINDSLQIIIFCGGLSKTQLYPLR